MKPKVVSPSDPAAQWTGALKGYASSLNHSAGQILRCLTSGGSLGPFIPAWEIDLFLSNDQTDVQAAVNAKAAAARLGPVPQTLERATDDEVRIAFDGDADVFSAESDEIYKKYGLEVFRKHELEMPRSRWRVTRSENS